MQKKIRKLNKDESNLWKEITKNDTKFKNYVEDLQGKKSNKNNLKNITEIKPDVLIKTNDVKPISIKSIQVNKRTRAKLERGMIRPEAILDLHGHSQINAKNILFEFISKAIDNNKRCVLIITGKKNTAFGAKGILRQKLPLWLKENSLARMVLLDCYAALKDGADGARYVLLRKKEKVENE